MPVQIRSFAPKTRFCLIGTGSNRETFYEIHRIALIFKSYRT